MRPPVTLVRPDVRSPDSRRISSALPADLLDQIRGRLRLLATFFFFAFGFDLSLFLGSWIYLFFTGGEFTPGAYGEPVAPTINFAGMLASAAIWWAARRSNVSSTRLYLLGSLYEIAVCFASSVLTFRQYYEDHELLPNMTWVPAVIILFPLVLPAPPRQMLGTALAAAASAPLALFLLELVGEVRVKEVGWYVDATMGPLVAVVFAYFGAKTVYGLRRAVAEARELGSYRLEEKLGEGGMGEVWRARHRMLARPAAIKLIRRSPDDASGVSVDARRRFEREAQVTASLRSPHTVELFDFGIADDGAFYYVMELLDGLDADTMVRRTGPVPAERAIHLLRQVCHSLSEAEAHGLVHRDIKPANIFLCRYGEDYDFVKVLDFGIVKAPHESTDSEATLTHENAVHGTPAFIAPEQALGGAPIDGRADIYATGCVAYWLLTGQLVFSADTPMGHVVHHATTPPTAPSTRTELPIPPALDRLVLACLAKEPKDRPQSAKELSRRLDEIEIAHDWTDERARDWWSLHQPERKNA